MALQLNKQTFQFDDVDKMVGDLFGPNMKNSNYLDQSNGGDRYDAYLRGATMFDHTARKLALKRKAIHNPNQVLLDKNSLEEAIHNFSFKYLRETSLWYDKISGLGPEHSEKMAENVKNIIHNELIGLMDELFSGIDLKPLNQAFQL